MNNLNQINTNTNYNSNNTNNTINENININNRENTNNINQNQISTTSDGNNNNYQTSDLEYINNILNMEMYNQIRQEIDEKTPLISESMDSLTLISDYQNNLDYLNSIQIIANKYQSIRKIRRDGNCFYRGFIYRIFEYICLHQDNTLYKKFLKKVDEAKDMAKKNNKLLTILIESYNLFYGEFCSCYNSLSNLNMSCRDYLDKLFQNNEKCNYLILFIRYCIAEYIRENRILYESSIEEDLDCWVEREVEPIDKEAAQVQIIACVNLFDISVKIEYLNKEKNLVMKFPESAEDKDIFITFLFTPGHYDLLYEK